MTTFFIEKSQIDENNIFINGEDAHHIKNVLRYKINDELKICDEAKNTYYAKISEFLENSIKLDIIKKEEEKEEKLPQISLYQGIPKADKMDFIVQKCTELGVFEIIPTSMERSIAKLDEKNAKSKIERWQKIAKEASMQSGRNYIPKISDKIYFKNIIENIEKYDIVLLPYENEKVVTLKGELMSFKDSIKGKKDCKIAIIIGPEGGISKEEVDFLANNSSKVKIISLGNNILRTETASIASVAMILYEFSL